MQPELRLVPRGDGRSSLPSTLPPGVRSSSTAMVARVNVTGPSAIRFWDPDTRRLQIAALIWTVALLVTITGLVLQITPEFWDWLLASDHVWVIPLLNATWGGMFWVVIIIPAGFAVAMSAARRPCTVATDDIGILIAGEGGRRVFRWEDVTDYEPFPLLRFMILRTTSGEQVRINTAGLSRDAFRQLHRVIEEKVV